MARVASKNTTPERAVRRILTVLGYRYRLHRRDLPGVPDIAFIGRRKTIFVHGCFWHGHDCRRGARVPKANRDYWIAKIDRNRDRDARARADLQSLGWRSIEIWECELRNDPTLAVRLSFFLEG